MTAKIKLLTGEPLINPWGAVSAALGVGVVQAPTATEIAILSEAGFNIVFHGTFNVVGGDVLGGTMTSYEVYTGSTLVIQGSGYTASGSALFDALQTSDFDAFYGVLFGEPLNVVGSKLNDDIETGEFNDVLLGKAGNDRMDGGLGNDLVKGNSGDDQVRGWLGDDILKGNKGNDVLEGDDGNDLLFGGDGKDLFAFAINPLMLPVGVDTIKDFKHGKDLIGITIFGPENPPLGYLEDKYFHKGTAATTADQLVIYDKKSGNIMIDLDGTGAQAQFVLASVKAGTKLHADDFYVQGIFLAV